MADSRSSGAVQLAKRPGSPQVTRMRPPRKTGGSAGAKSGSRSGSGAGQPPRLPRAPNPRDPAGRPRVPRPQRERTPEEVLLTSRRDAERVDARASERPKRPPHPKALPRARAEPASRQRSGGLRPDPAATAAPTGRRGRGDARAAARAAIVVPVEPQRIAKLLARAGVGSRRDIERYIAEGRVSLNGEVLTTPAMVISSLDGITVNGLAVAALEPTRLFRFHKPAGFLTTARDPGGRPTIMDILPPGMPRVVPVGRLDMNTEGLLLLTTDGGLKRALELPSNAVPRRYRVRAYGEFTQPMAEALIEGVTIDGMRYGSINAEIERRTGRNLWITMTLTEGKNREIRKVLEFLGLQVSRLIRVAYGPFELADLPPRDADEISDGQVMALRKSLAKT